MDYSIYQVSQEQACAHLEQFDLVDPAGLDTVQTVCRRGQAFALHLCGQPPVIFVTQWDQQTMWVLAAAGRTQGQAAHILQAWEHLARSMGARRIALQTARRGGARQLLRAGYEPNGYVFVKDL